MTSGMSALWCDSGTLVRSAAVGTERKLKTTCTRQTRSSCSSRQQDVLPLDNKSQRYNSSEKRTASPRSCRAKTQLTNDSLEDGNKVPKLCTEISQCHYEDDVLTELRGSLQDLVKDQIGGVRLVHVLEFLRSKAKWPIICATDILDACMKFQDAFFFRVYQGEIYLFSKELATSAIDMVPHEIGKRVDVIPFKPLKVQPLVPASDFFPVTVPLVTNPHEMVIKLMDTSKELSQLLGAMKDFYSRRNSEELLVAEEYLMSGCLCAFPVRFRRTKGWCRGVVKAQLEDGNVEVLDVDTGKIHTVSCHQIRLLMADFCELPRQAIHVGLAFIRPKASEWWQEASTRLTQLTQGKILMCSVVTGTVGIARILLCDTNNAEDAYLHTLLVEENLALASDDP